jgi:hypothetical protein
VGDEVVEVPARAAETAELFSEGGWGERAFFCGLERDGGGGADGGIGDGDDEWFAGLAGDDEGERDGALGFDIALP